MAYGTPAIARNLGGLSPNDTESEVSARYVDPNPPTLGPPRLPVGDDRRVALFWVALWLAFVVLRLPGPGNETVVGVVSAFVVFSLFFVMAYGCGKLAVVLFQRRVLARCPACREAAVGLKVWLRTHGDYRCRACGYIQPSA